MKKKMRSVVLIIVIACIILYTIVSLPLIQTRTWVLSSAQQTEAPYFIVAHFAGRDVFDIPLFEFSKPIELICEAKDGKLLVTNKTNEKTYEGTYKLNSLGVARRFSSFKGTRYTVFIEGTEGIATINGRTMTMVINNYSLLFEVK